MAGGNSWAIGTGRQEADTRGVAQLGMHGWNGYNL